MIKQIKQNVRNLLTDFLIKRFRTNKQLRQDVRSLLTGFTIAEIQNLLDKAIEAKRAGRADYIEEFLEERIKEFNDKKRRIKISYSIATPESVEFGDFADNGWEDEEGECIEIDSYDVAYYGDEHTAVAACAVDFLQKRGGGLEASDYPFCCPGHTWYTESEGDMDYSDGSEKMLSFHLDGFTEDEERAIYAGVTG